MSRSSHPLLRRLVRALLRLFPEDVRGITRADMEATFFDAYEAAGTEERGRRRPESGTHGRRRPGAAGAAFILREIPALIRHGAAERWEALEPPPLFRGSADDLRFALRALRRQPSFVLGAVVMLALGIGVNTAAFSVSAGMSRIVQRFHDADRLVFLWGVEEGRDRGAVSAPHYFAWRDEAPAFDAMGAFRSGSRFISGDGEPIRTRVAAVTPGLLPLLGFDAAVGRLPRAEEASPAADPVALLSWRLWQERYGGKEVLGRTLVLDDVAHTIVGVLPRTVEFEKLWYGVGVFVPLDLQAGATSWSERSYQVVARLAPGSSVEEARAQTGVITDRLAQAHPETNAGLRSRVEPFQGYFFSVEDRLAVGGILMAVLAVLLIACVNLANLLMAKGANRQGEVAIRLAVGASRGRILRQLLIESVILAGIGGAVGIVVGRWALDLLVSAMPSAPWLPEEAALDGTLLAYTFAVSLAAALAFGLTPALLAARASLSEGVKETGAAASAGRRRKRLRDWMLVTQLAVTVPLVLSCGISFLNLRALQEIDFGFPVEGLLTARIELPPHRYGDAESQRRFYRDVLDAVRTIPGVESAGAGLGIPLGIGARSLYAPMVAEGWESAEGSARGPSGHDLVASGYFETLGVPVLAGRSFGPGDTPDGPTVAVVNETLARRYWPDADPVGKRFFPETDPARLHPGYEPALAEPVTVVGVVRDFGANFYGEPPDAKIYLYQEQHPASSLLLVVRSQGDPLTPIPAIREAVARTDASVPVAQFMTGEGTLELWLQESRAIGWMLGVLGVLALGMALVGLYGMVSHSVVQRTFELGVRMVLGARRRSIELSVMGSFVKLAAVGTAVGVLIGLALGVLARSQLVNLHVPWVSMILGVTTLVMGVVVLAAWLPARRATTIEPVRALKCE